MTRVGVEGLVPQALLNMQDIKMLRSTVQQRDKERQERATLVAQEKLVSGRWGHTTPHHTTPGGREGPLDELTVGTRRSTVMRWGDAAQR
jgi:hypothetical protein